MVNTFTTTVTSHFYICLKFTYYSVYKRFGKIITSSVVLIVFIITKIRWPRVFVILRFRLTPPFPKSYTNFSTMTDVRFTPSWRGHYYYYYYYRRNNLWKSNNKYTKRITYYKVEYFVGTIDPLGRHYRGKFD